jgi:hypothetical protein
MALQTSGAISLANVQTEFGGVNPISISEYYGKAAGIPASGTISLSVFYGASAGPVTNDPYFTQYAMFYGGTTYSGSGYTPVYTYYNTLTRTLYTGSSIALVGSETSIGTGKRGTSGGTVSNKAVFTCGYNTGMVQEHILTNSTGALLNSTTSVNGYAFSSLSGASVDGDRATYLNGGYANNAVPSYQYWWYTDDSLVVGTSTSIGTYRYLTGGAGIGSKALFQGGRTTSNVDSSLLTRSNRNGTLVAAETIVGTAAINRASAGVNLTALFYGGYYMQGNQTLTRCDEDGTFLSEDSTLANSERYQYECAGGLSNISNPVMVIYAGNYGGDNAWTNKSSAINEAGVMVAFSWALGTARFELGGASSN